MNVPRSNREAIVISGWGWQTYNLPERIATALGRTGWRVLYCDNPASFLRKLGGKRDELAANVEGFRPEFLGHRLNSVPLARRWQARFLAKRILEQAANMGLEKPIAIYAHGSWVKDTARELRALGVFTVYICMDRLETGDEEALSEISDLVLVIPRTMYHKLKARFGDKVRWLPQFGSELTMARASEADSAALARLKQIPRPRLGYLGPPSFRVHARLLEELLTAHPDWHFAACGPVPGLKLPNLHDIGWVKPSELASVASAFDVGLMPYDCGLEMNLHCVPLKLFDYFAFGLPVVSTPVIHLWECADLIYLGSTAAELADGICSALAEAPDDPRRNERREIARAHSFEEMSRILPSVILDGANEFKGRALQRSLPVRKPAAPKCAFPLGTAADRTNSAGEPAKAVPNASSREAIVLSGWDWKTRNVPERIALALDRAGWRILYCENPASFLRRQSETRFPLTARVEGFRPSFVGHRLNALRFAAKWQARLLVDQVLEQARQMGLKRPVVIYPHGNWVVDVARELKARGISGVYVCMDHIESEESEAIAESSTATLVIPRATYFKLKAKFGDKIHLIPQIGLGLDMASATPAESRVLAGIERIPRPRLAYLGPPSNRLHAGLVEKLLTTHPDWHFVACGPVPGVQLPNIHDMGWTETEELAAIGRAIDVGLMPYDCANETNLHCVPLKLFDYFAAGTPVVSTPLIHLWEYGDLVYLGDSAEELAEGIRKALAEPHDDPRREERRRIAREHSMDEMAKSLPNVILRALERSRGPALHHEKALIGENENPEARPVSRGGA